MPGHVEIQFDLATVPDPLPLDFRDDAPVAELKINGAPAEIRQGSGHILLPGTRLRRGANRIELDFESGIAEANKPVTRYLDTQDGSEYLYTLFVPMDASLAFPCFDQPDLKAQFNLTVGAPADWVVVSNTAVSSHVVSDGRATTQFEQTNRQSALICLRLQRDLSRLSRAPG